MQCLSTSDAVCSYWANLTELGVREYMAMYTTLKGFLKNTLKLLAILRALADRLLLVALIYAGKVSVALGAFPVIKSCHAGFVGVWNYK